MHPSATPCSCACATPLSACASIAPTRPSVCGSNPPSAPQTSAADPPSHGAKLSLSASRAIHSTFSSGTTLRCGGKVEYAATAVSTAPRATPSSS